MLSRLKGDRSHRRERDSSTESTQDYFHATKTSSDGIAKATSVSCDARAQIAPCPATTLRGLLPNVSALAMISLRLAPKRTLKRRLSSSLQKRRPPRSPWNWVVAMDEFLSGLFPECAWRSELTRRSPASSWHWNIWDADHHSVLPAWIRFKWAFATAPLI